MTELTQFSTKDIPVILPKLPEDKLLVTKLNLEKNIPTAIELNGKIQALEATSKIFTVTEGWKYIPGIGFPKLNVKEKKSQNAGQILFGELSEKIADISLKIADTAESVQDKLEPKGIMGTIITTWNNVKQYRGRANFEETIRNEAQESTKEFFDSLCEQNAQIEHQKITFNGTTVNLYRVGTVNAAPQERWQGILQAVKVLDELHSKFGQEIPKEVTFYEISTFQDAAIREGSIQFDNSNHLSLHQSGYIFNQLGSRTTAGWALKNSSIFFGIARIRTNDEGASVLHLDLDWEKEVIRHEASHMAKSKYFSRGDDTANEGRALMTEFSYDFNTIKRLLRSEHNYGRRITLDTLKNIYKPYQDRNQPGAEEYYVSGSFLCFAYNYFCDEYKDLGPQKFMDFYYYLNGEKVKFRQAFDRYYAGNILQSLEFAMGKKSKSKAKSLVDQYLEKINAAEDYFHPQFT